MKKTMRLALEPLEPRLLLSATLLDPIDDMTVDPGDPAVQVDLSLHFDDPDITGTVVEINTPLGYIYLELYDATAPNTVANFLSYVDDGDYVGTIVHRSEPGLLIQGGGYEFPGWAHIATDPPVANEFGLSNVRGTIAMAKVAGDPDSATSEWFINLTDNSDPFDTDNGGYTVFGHVVGNAMDVVDAINALTTYDFTAPFADLPLRDYTTYPDPPPESSNVVSVDAMAQVGALEYYVDTDRWDLVTPSVDGETLTLEFATDESGIAQVGVWGYDVYGTYAECIFTVTLTGPPVVAGDAGDVNEGNSVVIDVLANDLPAGAPIDPTTVAIVDPPTTGTADVNPTTGEITYNSVEGGYGTYSFTYSVDNTSGQTSDIATVVVYVNPKPDVETPIGDLIVDQLTDSTVLDVLWTFDDPEGDPIIATFQTVYGNVEAVLFDDAAPHTVANFLDYARSGAYANTIIHRSDPGFVVQGGGYGFPSWEHIPEGPAVVNEFGISNTLGTIAMAKLGGDPNSATCEWFFNMGDNSENLDNQNGGFTVFAEVVSGMSAVDAIAALPTYDTWGDFDELPLISYSADPEPEPTVNEVVHIYDIVADYPLTLTVSSDNPGLVDATLDADNYLTLTYTPDAFGVATITVRATDDEGAWEEDSFIVTVIGGPEAVNDAATTDKNVAVAIDVLDNDQPTRVAIDPATVIVVGAAGHGTTDVDPVTGEVTYTPAADYFGPDSFTYTVDDVEGEASREATVSVTVNAPPVVADPLADIGMPLGTAMHDISLAGVFSDPDFTGTTLSVDTVLGSFLIELYDVDAPNTVANFLNYVTRYDYDDSVIHRSEAGHRIVGGAVWYPSWASIPADDPVASEYGISNTRGTLAAERDPADPDSATSMWFINTADNSSIYDDPGTAYTVFGHVIHGIEVVDAIAALPVYNFVQPYDALPLIDYTTYPDPGPGDDNVVLVHSVALSPPMTFAVESDNTALVNATVANGAITLEYEPDATGTATITVTATDLAGSTVQDTFTVLVQEAPDAVYDEAWATENQPLEIDVLANDIEGAAAIDPASVTIVDEPTHGTLDVHPATGVVTYTPEADYYGSDGFTYTVSDVDSVSSDLATVYVGVNAQPLIEELIDDFTVEQIAADTVLDLSLNFSDPDITGTIVLYDTSMGQVAVQLFDTDAPETVANFLNYVGRGDYDQTIVHRSVTDFVVQAGGYAYPTLEHIATDDPVVNEFGISNTRGTLAMAKLDTGPDTATSEWFFNLGDNSDNLDNQNGGFTVFGMVVGTGMAVVDAIAALPTFSIEDQFTNLPLVDYDPGQDAWPQRDNFVIIESIAEANPLELSVIIDNPGLVTATVDGYEVTLSYAPGATGVANVTVRATDLQGAYVEDIFTVSVNGPPVPVDDVVATDKDTAVLIDVLANDETHTAAIDPATVVVVDAPANGTADVDPVTGAITYTPAAGYVGPDPFTYTVEDIEGRLSGTGTVQVSVDWEGVVLGDGNPSTLRLTDPDGTAITIKHKGGTVRVLFKGYPVVLEDGAKTVVLGGDPVEVYRIELIDTTTSSSTTIGTKGGTVAGATLDAITGATPLGKLTAKTTTLVGDGIVLTGDGTILRTQLHDVENGADFTYPGLVDGATLTIALHHVADPGTDMTLALPVKTLSVAQWVGSSLTTPWIGKIYAKGDKKLALPGNFGVDLTLNGDPAPTHVLSYARVAGTVTGGTWDIDGAVGTLKAATFDADWELDADGYLKTLYATDGLGGTIAAAWFATVKSKYALSAALTATAAAPNGYSIGSVTAIRADGAILDVPGGIKKISLCGWAGGSIDAAWLSSLTTKPKTNLGLAGNFLTDLTLTGLDAPGYTLPKATIAGYLGYGTWTVTGGVGTITGKTDVDNWVCVVNGDVKSLKLGVVVDSVVTVNGHSKTILAQYWGGGRFNGHSIDLLKTTGNAKAGVPGHITAYVVLSGQDVPDGGLTLGKADISDGVGVTDWEITGDVGSIKTLIAQEWYLTVGGTVRSLDLGWVTDTYLGVYGDLLSIEAYQWDGGGIWADYLKTASLGYVPDATIAVTGTIDTLRSVHWSAGTVSADSVGLIQATGDKRTRTIGNFSADLVLAGTAATGDTLGEAKIAGNVIEAAWDITGTTGEVDIKYWLLDSQIHTTGNVDSLTAGGMDNSEVYAGVADAETGMLDPSTCFDGPATIGTLAVTGIPGAEFSFINTNLAAMGFGKLSIKNVQTDNVDHENAVFGIASQSIQSLTWKQAGASYKWPNRWPLNPSDDFLVDISLG